MGMSIAFLAEYWLCTLPRKAKSTLDVLWSAATKMVEGAERPGDTNQALIELGSTVCKVREPLCDRCPLRPWCKAYELSKGKVSVRT